MPKNFIISGDSATDIDQKVARLLASVGNPEPPLALPLIYEVLRLDRNFFEADDPGVLRTLISRIWVGTNQILQRPTLLLDVVRKMELRGLYVPDQKRILIDQAQPVARHRWLEAHEIGHSVLPWHREVLFGDAESTLTPACHEIIEAEANFAAARLLFFRDRFTREALDCQPSVASVQLLKERYGNTLTTTFWRCIETWGKSHPVVGLISPHPHPARHIAGRGEVKCRHFIQSSEFARRFSSVDEKTLLAQIGSYCNAKRGGPIGNGELIVRDDRGVRHCFAFETFFNSHDALTIGIHTGVAETMVAT